MYLVELTTGKETIYQSQDEFADAIRRGEVSSQSRIYHRTSSTWVSVTFHPQFRKISAEQTGAFAEPLPLRDWTFLRTDVSEEPPAREAAPQRVEAENTALPAKPGRNWRKMFSELIGHH